VVVMYIVASYCCGIYRVDQKGDNFLPFEFPLLLNALYWQFLFTCIPFMSFVICQCKHVWPTQYGTTLTTCLEKPGKLLLFLS